MSDYLKKEMEAAWRIWHNHIDDDDVPMVSITFEKGFNAASSFFIPMLSQSLVYVQSQADAEHMLDGFSHRHRAIDDFADRLLAIIE